MGKLYREYFNIDPKYYAAVTADLIEQGKVSLEGFSSARNLCQATGSDL